MGELQSLANRAVAAVNGDGRFLVTRAEYSLLKGLNRRGQREWEAAVIAAGGGTFYWLEVQVIVT